MIGPPIPVAWRLIGAGVLAAGLVACGAWAEHWRAGRARAVVEAAAQRQAAERAQEDQRITARLGARSQGVQDVYAAEARRARSAAEQSRAAAERLHDDLVAGQRSADAARSAGGVDAQAGTLRQLLDACSTEYRSVAAEAGDIAGRLDALQRWTGSICAASVAPEGARGDR